MIRVLKPGLLTTVQDLGRHGYTHIGVSPAGAADSVSSRLANLLVGNPEDAAVLECTLVGPVLEFYARGIVAITGSATSKEPTINEAFEVSSGSRLEIGSMLTGARAYIAVRGGIDVPLVMNSASTLLPASMGGFHGRALRVGDELSIGNRADHAPRKLLPNVRFLQPDPQPLRVTQTTQSDWFSSDVQKQFQSSVFHVTDLCDRSGIRLQGEAIVAERQSELITDGISLGAIQVPSNGQPIILFVDQQTTGGYPKIANVITADLKRVGQLRPRDEVRFKFISFERAVDLLRQQEHELHEAFSE
jgi:antagonist of KipI